MPTFREVQFRIILTLNTRAWLRQVPALILPQFRCKVGNLLKSGQVQPRGVPMKTVTIMIQVKVEAATQAEAVAEVEQLLQQSDFVLDEQFPTWVAVGVE